MTRIDRVDLRMPVVDHVFKTRGENAPLQVFGFQFESTQVCVPSP